MNTMRRRIEIGTGVNLSSTFTDHNGSIKRKPGRNLSRFGAKDSAMCLQEFYKSMYKMFNDKNDENLINQLSCKFAADFQNVLRRCYGTSKVEADSVYMQYMLNKDYVHIAKTKWKTLDEFIRYQGRLGHFLVEYTDKVWYLQSPQRATSYQYGLKDESPLSVFTMEDVTSKTSDEGTREQTTFEQIGNKKSKTVPDFLVGKPANQTDERSSGLSSTHSAREGSTLKNCLNTKHAKTSPPSRKCELSSSKDPKWTINRDRVTFKVSPRTSPYDKNQRSPLAKDCSKSNNTKQATRRSKSALEELMEEEERLKERRNRKDNWLQSGIIVRIASSKYGNKNIRKKCRLVGVLSPYTGVAFVLGTDIVLTVDQKHLSTVMPEVGRHVRIVNGAYRGEMGILEGIRNDSKCSVRITGSPLSGRSFKESCDPTDPDSRIPSALCTYNSMLTDISSTMNCFMTLWVISTAIAFGILNFGVQDFIAWNVKNQVEMASRLKPLVNEFYLFQHQLFHR